MIKRLISAALCLVMLVSAFSVNVFADATATNKLETKVADAKLYTENDKVEKGDIVTVTIYVENITAKNGILACDFPLSYDKSKLSFVKLDCIFPTAWGFYGEFFGHPTPDEDPWYLRSIPDAGDLIENYTTYSVKKSKELGYKLTFKAIDDGDAFVAVEDVGDKKIMLVAYEDDKVINYGGNGMKLTIKIGGKEDASTEPTFPEDSSAVESNDPEEPSGADSSDVVSDEPESSEESYPEESSEDVSIDADSSDDAPSEESSADASAEASDSSNEASLSSEDGTSDEGSAEEDNKEDKGGLPGFVIPVIIVVVVAALLGVGGFLFMKKKNDKEQ